MPRRYGRAVRPGQRIDIRSAALSGRQLRRQGNGDHRRTAESADLEPAHPRPHAQAVAGGAGVYRCDHAGHR